MWIVSYRLLIIASLGVFLTVVFSISNFSSISYAHITKKFGNVTIEVGWLNEPPVAGDMNSVTMSVNKASQGNNTPVLNALENVTSSIKYGTLTKSLDFVPSETADGLYEAQTIPTRSGSSYSTVINGGIEGQNINAEIPLDQVESRQNFAFPDSSVADTTSSASNVGPKIQGVLSQLSNTIQNMQGALNQMGKDSQNTKASVGSIEANLGKTYFIALSSIGVGLVGIVIAAFALSRKTRIQ